jgi:hypothetical protein
MYRWYHKTNNNTEYIKLYYTDCNKNEDIRKEMRIKQYITKYVKTGLKNVKIWVECGLHTDNVFT